MGYHELKLDQRFSYLTMFTCQFGSYRFPRLPFRLEPVGNMLQQNIDKIFKDMLTVFGTADDIFIAGYDADGRDHNKTFS